MHPSLKLVLATRNPGKVAEMRMLLASLPVTLYAASEFPGAPEIDEDRPTLEGNARKKAEALHAFTGLPALADDTGLEVAALDGRPGVHSARYAGPEADPAANRELLLRELAGAAERSARFRTVVALAEDGQVRCFEGACTGRILEAERGEGGFGYDALYAPDGTDQTFAELSTDEKNAISHRGRALRAVASYLRDRLGTRAGGP
jgi:XTP/dITP diphosphohydrolase